LFGKLFVELVQVARLDGKMSKKSLKRPCNMPKQTLRISL
jgi:hypothetical protein